jgi:hypothetical protein
MSSIALLDSFTPYTALSIVTTCSHVLWWTVGTKKTIGLKLNDGVTELSNLKSTVDNWKDMLEACLSQGSEIQCLVNLDELLDNIST